MEPKAIIPLESAANLLTYNSFNSFIFERM
jgi:hypothetical protein